MQLLTKIESLDQKLKSHNKNSKEAGEPVQF